MPSDPPVIRTVFRPLVLDEVNELRPVVFTRIETAKIF